MRKSLIIMALYIVGMVGAVIPYSYLETNEINDEYGILLFVFTYTIIFVLLLFYIITVLSKEWKPFINRLGTNIGIIIGFFFIASIASVLANLVITALGVTEEALNQGGLIDMLKYSEGTFFIILVLLFCIIIPIIEELVYRKGLYGFIRRFIQKLVTQYIPEIEVEKAIKIGSIVAILLSGLLFGLIHIQGDYIYLLHYATAGIVIGAGYYLSKENIYVPIAIHIIQNTFAVIQILTLIENGSI